LVPINGKNIPADFRARLAEILNSKVVEIAIVILIICYSLLVMTSIVLDDCDNSDRVENAVNTLKFVELGVVILFMVEIALRVYAFGFKVLLSLKYFIS